MSNRRRTGAGWRTRRTLLAAVVAVICGLVTSAVAAGSAGYCPPAGGTTGTATARDGGTSTQASDSQGGDSQGDDSQDDDSQGDDSQADDDGPGGTTTTHAAGGAGQQTTTGTTSSGTTSTSTVTTAPDAGSGAAGTTAGSPPAGALPAPAAPQAGVSVTLRPGSGTLEVRLPGSRSFIPLADAAQVPVGTTVDATHGRVILTSAVSEAGATKTGTFSGGRFVIAQTRSAHPATNLRLAGGSFAGACGATTAFTRRLPALGSLVHTIRRRRPSRKVVRQLWGSDHGGQFVTIGRSASAAVRGTVWLTQDRCDGTLVRVTRGRVLVHDAGRRRNVTIRAGHSYLARARP